MKKFWQLPNKTFLIWFLRFLFGFSLITFTLIYLDFFVAAYILAGIAGIALIYLLLFLLSYKIELRSKFLMIEKGIIFRITLLIPYKKIVYIKRLKTPLLKAFGLLGACIKTVNGTVFILEQEAEFISLLLKKIEEKEN